jgi:hypothetical protein
MTSLAALEPISTGDIIDRAVRLYRRNFTALISIVAIPSLIGYLASLMFWFGYSKLILGITSGPSISGLLMLGMGGLFYPVWFLSLLTAIAGVSRVVGDHIILGEAITFRRCVSAIRRRLGDIVLMGLLAIAVAMGLYTIFSILAFLVAMVFVVVIAAAAAVGPGGGIPEWLIGAVTAVALLALTIGAVILLLVVLARFIFLPQVVMIEGQSAGNALGRAYRLGAGNWHKLGGIALFTYFVTGSLLAALTLPFLVILYSMGLLTETFFIQPLWTIFYSAFSELTNLLVLPIWIVAFTMLYFDSRVRKEGYDVELMTRDLSPGFEWQPIQPPRTQAPPHWARTSPLGLSDPGQSAPGSFAEQHICPRCFTRAEPMARFCHVCGRPLSGRGEEGDSNVT